MRFRFGEAWPWVLGACVLGVAVVASKPKYTFGRPNTAKLNRDPARLQPAFADKLERLFRLLWADPDGKDAVLNEGWRSRERAKQLAGGGTGIEDSMHCYGLGADIVHRRLGWGAKTDKPTDPVPRLFKAVAKYAKQVGLFQLPNGQDPAHVQGVPVTNVAQNAVRQSADPNKIALKYLA